jgi:hypothetical protein
MVPMMILRSCLALNSTNGFEALRVLEWVNLAYKSGFEAVFTG